MTFIILLLKVGALRFATWQRDLTYDSEVYTAAGTLQGLQLPVHTYEPSNQTLGFQISLIAHTASVEGFGPVDTEVFLFYSEDGGATLIGPRYQFKGRLSRSAVSGKVWSGSVDLDRYNRLANEAEVTHERQKELHNNDPGLEFMAALEQGIELEL